MAIRGFHWQMISRLMQTVWAWASNNDHRDSRRDGFNFLTVARAGPQGRTSLVLLSAESSNPRTPGQYRGNVGLKSHFGS
jgi:hypothetical protein